MRRTQTIALAKAMHRSTWIATITFLLTLLAMMGYAHAAGTSTTMGTTVCAIAEMAQGNLGQAIAVLAVIVVGVGATMGKVSWGLAITVAVGIAVIFNAQNLVDKLVPGGIDCGGVN